ncbi:hypothetical protein BX600DRAFT_444054 [Xylariales sp. PMI_506]|nr:hypothetical protein BX600DRAFT_444054 [Xylariales sp. PMI_506]
MSLGFHCIYEPPRSRQSPPPTDLVDIVAVHGIAEDSIGAWKDPTTKYNWLRDFLPQHLQVARILTYGYDGTTSSFLANDAEEQLEGMAATLVQEFHGERASVKATRRPIIFICHGLGGLLVKQSLIYSSTRKAHMVTHLLDLYISTYAILFFGTPHGPMTKAAWLAYEQSLHQVPFPLSDPVGDSRAVEDDYPLPKRVHTAFTPLCKNYRLFFLWEQKKTSLCNGPVYIVDYLSAVPSLDNTETSGIYATHSSMVKFSSQTSAYFTVLAALDTYCKSAPKCVSDRWSETDVALQRLRAAEVRELTGIDMKDDYQAVNGAAGVENTGRNRTATISQYFYPPPQTTINFVGRSEMISKIAQAFFTAEKVRGDERTCFVIYGMGGSGKTQLSARFAYKYKRHYSAVFMIDATNKDTIRESFCKIATIGSLHPTENAGRHFLSQLDDSWLLIIDNADDPSLKLHDLFPHSEFVHILITTRNSHFTEEATVGTLELKGLTEDEALDLLLTKANIQKPWDSITQKLGREITKALGYLALAIIQAGTCIFRKLCKLTDYLAFHSAERSKLKYAKHLNENINNDKIFNTVYTTFDLSLSILSKRQAESRRDASELLRILSFYHFDNIPVEIFHRALKNQFESKEKAPFFTRLLNGVFTRLEPPRALPSFLRDADRHLDKYRINHAISELRSLSLVSYDGEYLALHPLVHAWARDRLSEPECKIWATVALNTIMESITLSEESDDASNSNFYRCVLTHLDACLHENDSLIPKSTIEATSLSWKFAIIMPTRLMIVQYQIRNAAKCGRAFAQNGQFEKAAEYLQMARDVLSKVLGPEHEKTMLAMLGLGAIYWGLSRPADSILLQERVVTACTKIHGAWNEQTLLARNALGKSYWLNGQHQEALDVQQATAEVIADALGESHKLTLEALDNLGVTLWALDRFEESLTLHSRVLAERIQKLGDKHTETLTTKMNRAMALVSLERLDEANGILIEIHCEREQQLGKEHPWTLWALCNLAKVKLELGLLQDAEEMLLWGIEAGIRSLGESHSGVCMGFAVLARVYARQGRLDESERLTRKTLKLVELSMGAAHPDYVFGLWKLAQLLILKGNRTEAIRTCHLGLERAEQRISAKHPLSKKLTATLNVLLDQTASESDLAGLVPRISQKAVATLEIPSPSPTSSTMKIRNTKIRTATW